MPHVQSFKNYTNKKAKEISEDQMVMGVNPAFQGRYDALNQEEATLLEKLAEVKRKRSELDMEMIKADQDAANKAAELAKQASQAQVTATDAAATA